MGRINKCIELLEQGQPIFATGASELTYDAGKDMAQTYADMILVEFEHHPFDPMGLQAFMRGLKDGGPTPSGHATPTVVSTLPSNCISREEVLYNAWQSRQILSTGAHGLLHTHARTADAVKAFVATARYPFQKLARDVIAEGLRGAGGQGMPAEIWGGTAQEYVKIADPWPLNPEGEILLGLKIEDRHSLPEADAIAAVPGIGFAEWGPGDMGMSFGNQDAHAPPYPDYMDNARNTVKAALDKAGVAFYSGWKDGSKTEEQNMEFVLNELGARMTHAGDKELTLFAHKLAGRTMPV